MTYTAGDRKSAGLAGFSLETPAATGGPYESPYAPSVGFCGSAGLISSPYPLRGGRGGLYPLRGGLYPLRFAQPLREEHFSA